MKQQINEVRRMQQLAGVVNESEMKIYGTDGTESTIDLGLIDTLAKQIGPASGYADWEERIANIDYKSVINTLAKQILKLGALETDRITFKK